MENISKPSNSISFPKSIEITSPLSEHSDTLYNQIKDKVIG